VTNRNKARGTAFETAVANYLGVERRALKGAKDQGDLIVPGWAVECKATRTLDVAGAMDEARVEAQNLGVTNYAAIIKRRQKGVAQAYFVMELADARRLLKS